MRARPTIEQMYEIAATRGGRCLSERYVTARQHLAWECQLGHRWTATPDNVKRGRWCPECAKAFIRASKIKYSTEDCSRYAEEHGGRFVEEHQNAPRNCLWECRRGHRWWARPSQVLRQQTWCKRCQTMEARVDEITRLFSERDIRVVCGEIRNAQSKVRLECRSGHTWETTLASVHFQQSGCPLCAGQTPLTLDIAQRIATEKGGRCLSTEYRNARTRLVWECARGHRWEATLDSVGGGRRSSGTWCRECWRLDMQPKYTYEDAVALAKSRGGEFLSPSMGLVLEKYQWRCANGHVWSATYSSISNTGTWCPSCSRHLGERLTRIAFESLFGEKFPTSRPEWLRSEQGTQLSLDGYCESLGLAFEHQGEQHYSASNYFGNTPEEQQRILEHDRTKRMLCQRHGVTLVLVPEVPRLTLVDSLVEFVCRACSAVGRPPALPHASVYFERAYVEDGRLHRLTEAADARGGKLVERTYFGMRHRYTWRCSEEHEWQQTAQAVVNVGTWCPYCSGRHNISLDLLQEKAHARGGRVLTSEYRNNTQRITCECVEGHVFQRIARNLLKGSWCPDCRK